MRASGFRASPNTDLAEHLELFNFGGLTYQQIGQINGTSEVTVKRKLKFARAWVGRTISEMNK